MIFEDVIYNLEALGVADVLLPFILIFTIVFAILQQTKILGENSKNFNVIVALVMGLAVVIPHVLRTYPPGYDVVEIMNRALPNVSIILVAILMLLIIIGIFGGNTLVLGNNHPSGLIVLLAGITVGWIFLDAAGWFGFPEWLRFLRDPQTQSTVVTILVFAIIIWFITRDDPEDGDDNGNQFWTNWNPNQLLKDRGN